MRCPTKLNQTDASCCQAIFLLAPVYIIARVPPIYSLARLNKLPISLVCTVTRVPPNCLANIYELLLFRALLAPYDSTNQNTTKLLQAPVSYTEAEISSTSIGNYQGKSSIAELNTSNNYVISNSHLRHTKLRAPAQPITYGLIVTNSQYGRLWLGSLHARRGRG